MKRLALALAIWMALAVAACGDDNGSSTDNKPRTFNAAQYGGTYEGTWTNSATGATGPARIVIDIDDKAKTASLTLDFDGNYLGLGDPPPAKLTGVFDSARATVKGKSELFGDYDVTIDADGKIVGLMQNLGNGAIPKMSYTGTLTASQLDADYAVTFADGKTANAILRMQKKK